MTANIQGCIKFIKFGTSASQARGVLRFAPPTLA